MDTALFGVFLCWNMKKSSHRANSVWGLAPYRSCLASAKDHCMSSLTEQDLRFTSSEVTIQSSVVTWTAGRRRQQDKGQVSHSDQCQVSHTDHEVQRKRTTRPLSPLCCPTALEMTFQQDPLCLWRVEQVQDMPTNNRVISASFYLFTFFRAP